MKQFQEIVDIVRGNFKQPVDFIPLHSPTFNGNEKKYLNECIDSTFVAPSLITRRGGTRQ